MMFACQRPHAWLLHLLLLASVSVLQAETYTVTTFSGHASVGSADGPGAEARFFGCAGVVVDASGNAYVADMSNHVIRRITPAGLVSTLAGSPGIGGRVNGSGAGARFNQPIGIAMDASGDLYVTEFGSFAIRKVTQAGLVSTYAGSLSENGSADGSLDAARFQRPHGLAFTSSGDLVIADTGNHTIRIVSGGTVSTLAGLAGNAGSTDGSGASARFDSPTDIVCSVGGDIYVSDTSNHTIRTVTTAGLVSTLAGTPGLIGTVDGNGASARFNYPKGIELIGSNLYVAQNQVVRVVSIAGVASTLAGDPAQAAVIDGSGATARFGSVFGIAATPGGSLLITESAHHVVRTLTTGGLATTLAGSADSAGSSDGSLAAARFRSPRGIAVASDGTWYVADANNYVVRKISPAGTVSVLAGATGMGGYTDGVGSDARFSTLDAVATGPDGTIYALSGQMLRAITPAGSVSTIAGTSNLSGAVDGLGAAARFDSPAALVVDGGGIIYIADTWNHAIRKVMPDGTVTTFAGSLAVSGSTDGSGANARFAYPQGIAVDDAGNLYVCDTGNKTIRTITPLGVVSTLAGSAGLVGTVDGVGSAARFESPTGIVLDGAGRLFVSESESHCLRRVSLAGMVTTVAGSSGLRGSADGVGSAARFYQPQGLAVRAGTIYVADSVNNTIRAIAITSGAGSGSGGGTGGGTGSGGGGGGGGCAAGSTAMGLLLVGFCLVPRRRRR